MVEDRTALDSSLSERTYVEPFISPSEFLLIFFFFEFELIHSHPVSQQETGPHLFEFSPAGTAFEYYAHSIGARSQSAKTYLEKNYHLFPTASLEELINHGLSALHDTLQQDKHLSSLNTSIAIIGPAEGQGVEDVSKSAAAQRGGFRVWENEGVEGILRGWRRSRGEPEEGPEEEGEAQGEPSAEGQTEAGAGQQEGQPPAEDVTMQE